MAVRAWWAVALLLGVSLAGCASTREPDAGPHVIPLLPAVGSFRYEGLHEEQLVQVTAHWDPEPFLSPWGRSVEGTRLSLLDVPSLDAQWYQDWPEEAPWGLAKPATYWLDSCARPLWVGHQDARTGSLVVLHPEAWVERALPPFLLMPGATASEFAQPGSLEGPPDAADASHRWSPYHGKLLRASEHADGVLFEGFRWYNFVPEVPLLKIASWAARYEEGVPLPTRLTEAWGAGDLSTTWRLADWSSGGSRPGVASCVEQEPWVALSAPGPWIDWGRHGPAGDPPLPGPLRTVLAQARESPALRDAQEWWSAHANHYLASWSYRQNPTNLQHSDFWEFTWYAQTSQKDLRIACSRPVAMRGHDATPWDCIESLETGAVQPTLPLEQQEPRLLAYPVLFNLANKASPDTAWCKVTHTLADRSDPKHWDSKAGRSRLSFESCDRSVLVQVDPAAGLVLGFVGRVDAPFPQLGRTR